VTDERSSRHAHKARNLRGVDDETWELFGQATTAMGLDRSAALRVFIRWYLHQGELPDRPESG
jgi:antitoxin component of RelBE/YafQ-DinJ toxin-antitoxin module